MRDRARRTAVRIDAPLTALTALAGVIVLAASPGAFGQTPSPAESAATPVLIGASPTAPNPHPPLGGRAPDSSVPGGAALASRGLILPPGAAKLPKNLTAKSWILVDLDSGNVLAGRDPHGRYQPASILKTLTALTILPRLASSRRIMVTPAAAAAEGSAVGLLPGASYTADELFKALMLVSANDAAAALADANGGAVKTVAEMNQTARRLGAYDTFVQTPSGLDGWKQLTSAYDMALVLRAALADPRFIAYDRTRSATFPPKKSKYGSVGVYQFDNQSSNFLDGVPGALVAKTGYTDAALHTYVAAAERGTRRLGLVFLRNQRIPEDQYQQAAALFKWGFSLKQDVPAIGTLPAPVTEAAPRLVSGPSAPASPFDPRPSASSPHAVGAAEGVRGGNAQASAAGTSKTRDSTALAVTAGMLAISGGVAARRRRHRRPPRRR